MRSLYRGLAFLLAVAAVIAPPNRPGVLSPAAAANWERFRGPNGTGVAADKDVPVRWQTENVLWKTALPGKGNSSPIVWNDRLFLQTASTDGMDRSLVCIETRTGQILWTRSAPGVRATIHKRNSWASCTPATDGERVYCLFWDGKDLLLTAYDFTGKQVWKRELGGYTSQHGAGHSPIVHDGRVFLANDQDGTAVLLCFDARTGKTVWEAKRPPFRACYSTPLLHDRPDGGKELLVGSTAGITSYDPASGKVYWNYSWSFTGMPLRTVASPIVADGMVLQSAGDGSGARHAIAVKLGGKGNVTETALAWENTKNLPYVPTMLSQGEYVYSVNDKGIAACHVAKTGKEVWSERLGSPVTASPLLIDGKIYAAGEDGKVYVYAASPKFSLLAQNTLDEAVYATPAVANDRLYIRGKEHLYCIGKQAK